MHRTLTLIAALLLAPPVLADSHGHDTHLSTLPGLRVLHAWARATNGPEAQIYAEIENTSDHTITLTGGEAKIGKVTGVMGAPIHAGSAPVPLGKFDIPAGAEFDLGPETVYLQVKDLTAPLTQGDSFDAHMIFGDLGEVEVHVTVEPQDAHQHSHAGHGH